MISMKNHYNRPGNNFSVYGIFDKVFLRGCKVFLSVFFFLLSPSPLPSTSLLMKIQRCCVGFFPLFSYHCFCHLFGWKLQRCSLRWWLIGYQGSDGKKEEERNVPFGLFSVFAIKMSLKREVKKMWLLPQRLGLVNRVFFFHLCLATKRGQCSKNFPIFQIESCRIVPFYSLSFAISIIMEADFVHAVETLQCLPFEANESHGKIINRKWIRCTKQQQYQQRHQHW